MSRRGSEEKTSLVKILAIIGLVIAVLFIGAVVLLLPVLARAREEGRRTVCKNNMRQMGLAISMYSQTHMDQAPPNLEALMPNEISDEKIFRCLSAQTPGNNYIYFPLKKTLSEVPMNAIVVIDKKTNHKGEGRNLLGADAHVEWVAEKDVPAVLGKMLAPPYVDCYTDEAIQEMKKIAGE